MKLTLKQQRMIETGNAWLVRNAVGCEQRYQRELARIRVRGKHHYIPKKPYKSPEWTQALARLISAYSWAATKLREIPPENEFLFRGPLPWHGGTVPEDSRLQYISRLLIDLGVTADADRALRDLYEALEAFYRVTNAKG